MSDDIKPGDLVRCFRLSWDKMEAQRQQPAALTVRMIISAGVKQHVPQGPQESFEDDELFYGIAIKPGACNCCKVCRATGWYVLSKQWGMQLYENESPDCKDAWNWTITPVRHEDER